MFNVASFITALVLFFPEGPRCWVVSPLYGFAWSLGGVETREEVARPSLPVTGMWSGSGRNSSLGVWTDLSWFLPGLSLELRPTDGSTALPVLGGLVRRVPPAKLI